MALLICDSCEERHCERSHSVLSAQVLLNQDTISKGNVMSKKDSKENVLAKKANKTRCFKNLNGLEASMMKVLVYLCWSVCLFASECEHDNSRTQRARKMMCGTCPLHVNCRFRYQLLGQICQPDGLLRVCLLVCL